MSTPLISVITPCYNHGAYIEEAIESLSLDRYKDVFEHIIVDDGSTDEFTIQKFRELESKGHAIIHQPNGGLGNARNTALKAARGKYILPLDSDNKIVPEVMLRAVRLLEEDPAISVVYTDAYRFGDIDTDWNVGPFDFEKILFENYIDACSLIRKEVLLQLGGYDEQMPVMGYEDWELWVRIHLSGGKLHYLPEKGYWYRVLQNSMVRTVTMQRMTDTRRYIFNKQNRHIDQFADLYHAVYKRYRRLHLMEQYMKRYKLRSVLKLLLNKPFYS